MEQPIRVYLKLILGEKQGCHETMVNIMPSDRKTALHCIPKKCAVSLIIPDHEQEILRFPSSLKASINGIPVSVTDLAFILRENDVLTIEKSAGVPRKRKFFGNEPLPSISGMSGMSGCVNDESDYEVRQDTPSDAVVFLSEKEKKKEEEEPEEENEEEEEDEVVLVVVEGEEEFPSVMTETCEASKLCVTLLEEVRQRLDGKVVEAGEEVEQPIKNANDKDKEKDKENVNDKDKEKDKGPTTWEEFVDHHYKKELKNFGKFEADMRKEARQMAKRLFEEARAGQDEDKEEDMEEDETSPWPAIEEQVLEWLEKENPNWMNLEDFKSFARWIEDLEETLKWKDTSMSQLEYFARLLQDALKKCGIEGPYVYVEWKRGFKIGDVEESEPSSVDVSGSDYDPDGSPPVRTAAPNERVTLSSFSINLGKVNEDDISLDVLYKHLRPVVQAAQRMRPVTLTSLWEGFEDEDDYDALDNRHVDAIWMEQDMTDLILDDVTMTKVVKKILQERSTNVDMSKEAVQALLVAAQDYALELFENANAACIQRDSQAIVRADMQTARRIRGERC